MRHHAFLSARNLEAVLLPGRTCKKKKSDKVGVRGFVVRAAFVCRRRFFSSKYGCGSNTLGTKVLLTVYLEPAYAMSFVLQKQVVPAGNSLDHEVDGGSREGFSIYIYLAGLKRAGFSQVTRSQYAFVPRWSS